jgi:murein DD-endopeptidase MepM/ murein hydrolase activator NlpD
MGRAARRRTAGALTAVLFLPAGLMLAVPDGSTATAVDQARALGRAATASGGPLVRPTTGIVTSGFGPRVFPSFGQQEHLGVDFAAPTGTAVVAAADGIVTLAEHQEAVGNIIIVWHGQTAEGQLATVYGHLDSMSVAVGDRVEAGAEIGAVGTTGTHALGPHLHFEVHVDGEPVDPADWL